MATRQKKQKPAPKTKPPKNLLDLPVSFGGVAIGENTARLGLKINRESLNIVAADEALCGRRLTGSVQLGGNSDSPGQTKMFETDSTVSGTFDVHRFGVAPKHYTTGLTFVLAEIDVSELAKFSKGEGRLIVSAITELDQDDSDTGETDDE